MGSKKMKSPSPSRLLFLLVCLLSSFHRAPAASASESPEGERGASETRKSTRRYVQSDDSHSLWFAGLRSGLEHRDPSGGGDVGGFVLTDFLGDNRREGGNETYRLRSHTFLRFLLPFLSRWENNRKQILYAFCLIV